MSIIIKRMLPIINGYVQRSPNLESEKTLYPQTTEETFQSIPEIIRFNRDPLQSNSFEVDLWQTVPHFDDNF